MSLAATAPSHPGGLIVGASVGLHVEWDHWTGPEIEFEVSDADGPIVAGMWVGGGTIWGPITFGFDSDPICADLEPHGGWAQVTAGGDTTQLFPGEDLLVTHDRQQWTLTVAEAFMDAHGPRVTAALARL